MARQAEAAKRGAAVQADMAWLAILGVIASVIGAFYYLRIVYYMFFGAETEGVESRMGGVQYLALVVPAAMLLIGAVSMWGVDTAAARAAESLVGTPLIDAGLLPDTSAVAPAVE